MADQRLPAEQVDGIRDSCAFGEPAIDLGVLGNGGGPATDARIRIPLRMVARHGLIAGATGTGKTITLQLLAESLSAAGVPVLAADIEGDLSGIALPGVPGDGLAARPAAGARAAEAEGGRSARQPRQEPAPVQEARRGRPRREKSVVGQVAEPSILERFARSAGRGIVRSLFGTGRRR